MKPVKFKLIFVIVAVFCTGVWAQLPVLRAYTPNNTMPQTSNVTANPCGLPAKPQNCQMGFCMPGGSYSYYDHSYIVMDSIRLTVPSNSRYNLFLARPASGGTDSIRGRGNSTSTQQKRPFRIRFNSRQGLFGKTPARSWALLANHFERTSTLNAIAFSLGHRLGLPYTPTSEFVEMYVNNQYLGLYQMTEQIQVNPGRVNIDDMTGWLVEYTFQDPKAKDCQSYFITSKYDLTTFIKSPEDLPDSTGYRFVKRDINRLVDSMASNRFPNNGYRDFIDLESFAKYVLIQQLIDNHDFNSHSQDGAPPGSNYAWKDHNTRIHAGPLWDFDLSTGEFQMGFNYTHFTNPNRQINPRHPFYQRLWQDTVFLVKFKKAWQDNQAVFNTQIPAFIDSLAGAIKASAIKNYRGCPAAGGGGGWGGGGQTPACNTTNMVDITAINSSQYDQEITKLKNWWRDRVQFFGQQVNALNIDMSKDINQNPQVSVAPVRPVNTSKSLTLVKNGFKINATNSASIKVFNLNGSVIHQQKFSGGNHAITLENLPKGMYMVNITIDNKKQVLRVPVR